MDDEAKAIAEADAADEAALTEEQDQRLQLEKENQTLKAPLT